VRSGSKTFIIIAFESKQLFVMGLALGIDDVSTDSIVGLIYAYIDLYNIYIYIYKDTHNV
jgi:hypothetical protein